MFTLTFDANCIVAIDNKEANAPYLHYLIQQHQYKKCDICLVAISASERQRGGHYLNSYSDFENKINSLGLDKVGLLLPVGYWDVTFYDKSIYSSEEILERERSIHEILFPDYKFYWEDESKEHSIDIGDKNSPQYRKWRNRKCDVLTLLAHWMNKRDCFVTDDRNFIKKTDELTQLGVGKILTSFETAERFGFISA